ncbi:Carnitinyl-CoA dehydratase [Thalassocella blandensis]|nr:Carnitinyl-CoA dehydratase [Thalassocella blandensis]
MSTTYECFEISVEDGIAHLQLSRPQKANSLTQSFWTELPQAVQKLNRSGEVRILVISAQGKTFCGGLDLNMFAECQEFRAASAIDREALQAVVLHMQDAINSLERARFPVIAAIQGTCIGAGLDLISACDFCFATENVTFRIEETNIGMMADLGVLQRLPRLIPPSLARYLALTGNSLSAEDALRYGLLVRTFPDSESLMHAALATAKQIAEKPPIAINGIKRAMIYSRDHGVYEALEHTAMLQMSYLNGADIMRAMESRASGNAADFANLHSIPTEK